MRIARVVLLVAFSVSCAFVGGGIFAAEPVKEGKSDKDLLQGSWRMTAMDKKGEKTPEQEFKDRPQTLKFDGDVATADHGRGVEPRPAGYVLDTAKSPKQITVTPKEPEKPMTGIYELTGDTLRMAFIFAEGAGTPPADFGGGKDVVVITFERVKEGK